jgi:hypothetical protein
MSMLNVNEAGLVKKHEQHVGGQLWLQGERQMTAINLVPPEMKSEEKSAALIAVAEAVEWRHAFEPVGLKRQGQRIVIYPPFLDKLEQVLESGDSNCDPEATHDIAYQSILNACHSFETLLKFYSSDSPELPTSDIADKVPLWMNMANEISIGGRGQVLEDGADLCNSESDSENEDPGDVLTGCYVGIPLDYQGSPLSADYKLSEQQAAALRWEAQQSKVLPCPPHRRLPLAHRYPPHIPFHCEKRS